MAEFFGGALDLTIAAIDLDSLPRPLQFGGGSSLRSDEALLARLLVRLDQAGHDAAAAGDGETAQLRSVQLVDVLQKLDPVDAKIVLAAVLSEYRGYRDAVRLVVSDEDLKAAVIASGEWGTEIQL